MSTRSAICYRREDGTVVASYCHNNGFPSWVGKILLRSYTDFIKVKDMVDLGPKSTLRDEIWNPPKDHSFNSPADGHTVFYHRDRGEDLPEPKEYPLDQYKPYDWIRKLANEMMSDYIYVFEIDMWVCFKVYPFGKIDLYDIKNTKRVI